MCIYTHIHKNADCQLARVPTGAYGCPRVPTGLEKSVFFIVFTIRKCPFKGQKYTKIVVADLSVSTHGRVQLEPTKILRNTSCTYDYIYMYMGIHIYMSI